MKATLIKVISTNFNRNKMKWDLFCCCCYKSLWKVDESCKLYTRIMGVFTGPWNPRGRKPSWSPWVPGKDPFAVWLFPVVTEVTSNFEGRKISARCVPTGPCANWNGHGPGERWSCGPRMAFGSPGGRWVRGAASRRLLRCCSLWTSRTPALGRGWLLREQQSFPGGGDPGTSS